MGVFRLIAVLCAALSGGAALAQPAATTPTTDAPTTNAAGKVEFVEGDVRFLDQAQRLRRPRSGDPINEGESIVTGTDGEVHLEMADGGFIAVRPGTRMRIMNYRAEGDANDRSVMSLLEGSFRSITGWIGRFSPRNYSVQTPTATIGVRGTDHEPRVIPEGSALGEPGTYDRVHVGGTTISGKQGTIDVAPGRAGFFPFRAAARPRVLDSVPAFFRPSRNEGRFAQRHEQVQRVIGERREERRRVIEQRRRELDPRGQESKDAQERSRVERERKMEEQRRDQLERQREQRERKAAEQTRRNETKERKQRELDARQRELQEQRVRERDLKQKRLREGREVDGGGREPGRPDGRGKGDDRPGPGRRDRGG